MPLLKLLSASSSSSCDEAPAVPASSKTSHSHHKRTHKQHHADNTTDNSAAAPFEHLLQLHQAKIANLEEVVAEKDDVIHELRSSMATSKKFFKQLSRLQLDTSSSASSVNTSVTSIMSLANQSIAQWDDDDDVVQQLQVQLEESSLKCASLQTQLEEQKALNSHLQSRVELVDNGKAELASQVASLEKQVFDQANQIECLQALNESNTQVAQEFERVQDAGSRASYQYQGKNQWQVYSQLQDLMARNNQLSQQLSVCQVQKQQADARVNAVEQEQDALRQELQQLQAKLEAKEQELTELQQLQVDASIIYSDTNQAQPTTFFKSCLPGTQQFLQLMDSGNVEAVVSDANNDCDTKKETASATVKNDQATTTSPPADISNQELRLLQLSLQASQSQLRQLQREQQSQITKAVKQSEALAEAHSRNDQLQAKVEHYEALLDTTLEQGIVSPQVGIRSGSSHGVHKRRSKSVKAIEAAPRNDGRLHGHVAKMDDTERTSPSSSRCGSPAPVRVVTPSGDIIKRRSSVPSLKFPNFMKKPVPAAPVTPRTTTDLVLCSANSGLEAPSSHVPKKKAVVVLEC